MELHKAQGVNVPDLNLTATKPTPDFESTHPGWEKELREKWNGQAKIVFDALLASLPGGTFDALMVQMLDHKRALLQVPMFGSPSK